jgi:hypothetical protein
MARKTAKASRETKALEAPKTAVESQMKPVKGARARPSPASPGGPAEPAEGVRVRMYCHGLGDCFLLSFSRGSAGSPPFHVLIDCGVIHGTPNSDKLIRLVVADLLAETGGRIDLLIATHEHWDHLSGFVQARDLFEESDGGLRDVGQIWMAWTEDPDDHIASRLVAERKARLTGLAKATGSTAFRSGFKAADPELKAALETLSFFGIDVSTGLGAASQSGGMTTDALQWLRSRKEPRYLEPSDGPLKLEGLGRARLRPRTSQGRGEAPKGPAGPRPE